jgi:hypothetical protein
VPERPEGNGFKHFITALREDQSPSAYNRLQVGVGGDNVTRTEPSRARIGAQKPCPIRGEHQGHSLPKHSLLLSSLYAQLWQLDP